MSKLIQNKKVVILLIVLAIIGFVIFVPPSGNKIRTGWFFISTIWFNKTECYQYHNSSEDAFVNATGYASSDFIYYIDRRLNLLMQVEEYYVWGIAPQFHRGNHYFWKIRILTDSEKSDLENPDHYVKCNGYKHLLANF